MEEVYVRLETHSLSQSKNWTAFEQEREEVQKRNHPQDIASSK